MRRRRLNLSCSSWYFPTTRKRRLVASHRVPSLSVGLEGLGLPRGDNATGDDGLDTAALPGWLPAARLSRAPYATPSAGGGGEAERAGRD